MRTIDSPTAHRSVAAAHRRAGEHPDARLACPVCAASLKGANFSRHLHDKHPDIEARPAGETSDELQLVGIDRRIRRAFAVIGVVWLAALGAAIYFDANPIETGEDPSAARIAEAPFVKVLAVGLVIAVVIALLRAATAFRARITVTDDGIRLRHRLGTGSRRLSLPATVETGSLFSMHTNRTGESDAHTRVRRHAGAYLRVIDGRRTITVGCPHATDIRKHWTGWTSGSRRKWWDIDLSAPAFVELQYALAEAGCLESPH